VSIGLSLVGSVAQNPAGYVIDLASQDFATYWIDQNKDNPLYPWGWVSGKPEEAKSLVSISAMNERLEAEFLGLDPFQLQIASGDADKVKNFIDTGSASTKKDFNGVTWVLQLAVSDPFPDSGMALGGFTKEGAMLYTQLPGLESTFRPTKEEFANFLLGVQKSPADVSVFDTDMTTCQSYAADQIIGAPLVAIIMVDPSQSVIAAEQATALYKAILDIKTGPLTAYRAISLDNRICVAIINGTTTHIATPTPTVTATLSVLPVLTATP
jgi:hypothetical protein